MAQPRLCRHGQGHGRFRGACRRQTDQRHAQCRPPAHRRWRRGGALRRQRRDASRSSRHRQFRQYRSECRAHGARAAACICRTGADARGFRQIQFEMMSMPGFSFYCRSRGPLAAIAFVLAFGAAFAAHAQSAATNVPNAMQGFAQNRDQPIQIEAASLEMRDKKKEATFSGNVKVIQGDTTMTSKILVVFYESSEQNQNTAPAPSAKGAAKSAPIQAAAPGPGGSSQIKRLEAKGNVVVTQKDQVVTGDTAVFDTKTNLITMLGGAAGVVLTQ